MKTPVRNPDVLRGSSRRKNWKREEKKRLKEKSSGKTGLDEKKRGGGLLHRISLPPAHTDRTKDEGGEKGPSHRRKKRREKRRGVPNSMRGGEALPF